MRCCARITRVSITGGQTRESVSISLAIYNLNPTHVAVGWEEPLGLFRDRTAVSIESFELQRLVSFSRKSTIIDDY